METKASKLRVIREEDEMGEVKRWERKREPKARIREGDFTTLFLFFFLG